MRPSSIPPASKFRGLRQDEALQRLAAEGYNELPPSDRRTALRIAIEVLREPMLALLLVGGALYLALGDRTEALVLIAFATLSVAITTVQETRTERVLEALRDLTSPRALVIRDGERQRIAGREVVRGDYVAVSEGDRVPADARLLEGHDLQADESLLTGESAPVRKVMLPSGAPSGEARPGGDDLPFLFSGSLVVRGAGIAEVIAIGKHSEIGRIGQSLKAVKGEPPPLQTQTRRVVRVFGAIGGAVSLLAVILYGTFRGGWLDASLAGVALGMSMVPQEFPVVLTVFMAMGAWRISQVRVLTRRAASIETLGSTTVLCTDKTGTLTQNHMSVSELQLPTGESCKVRLGEGPLEERYRTLAEFAILGSAAEPVDPMERALRAFGAERAGQGDRPGGPDWRLVRAYGLRPGLLALTHVWRRTGDDGDAVVATKGAPEVMARLCHLDADARASVADMADRLASEGMRVLGVARGTHRGPVLPESQEAFSLDFLGLIGLRDPLRAGVPEAVAACRSAGIKVIMITGDHVETARAIAAQAGIPCDRVLTGGALLELSEAELRARVSATTVFARILPEQKLQIVEALKASGEIVAMTGDGVNDAPSLKAAHIGIAMGGRGTDVAREASAIVLLDDDFGSIVKAIRLGRRIYDNVQKAMGFIFAVHVPIAGLALMPLPFGLPIILGPIHIALLEMVIDPVSSLVFEAETEEEDIMGRPPRRPDAPLFPASLILWGLTQGTAAFSFIGGTYLLSLAQGMPEEEVRALTFFCLVLTIVSLIFVNRSFSPSLRKAVLRSNRALAAVLSAVGAVLSLALVFPWATRLLRFGPLHANDVAAALGVALLVFSLLDRVKVLGHRAA